MSSTELTHGLQENVDFYCQSKRGEPKAEVQVQLRAAYGLAGYSFRGAGQGKHVNQESIEDSIIIDR